MPADWAEYREKNSQELGTAGFFNLNAITTKLIIRFFVNCDESDDVYVDSTSVELVYEAFVLLHVIDAEYSESTQQKMD